MNRLFTIIALLFLFVPLSAQTKKTLKTVSPQCQLSQAPSLRGFSLGQTVSEIDTMMPRFKVEYEKEKNSESNINDEEIGWSYMNFGDMDFPNPELKDAVITLHFLDDKVIYISAKYQEFEPKNLRGFTNQLIEKTNLPKEGWKIEDKFNGVLNCNGFKVEVATGEDVGRPGYLDLPSITLIDTIADVEKEKRRKAIEIKKKNAERERIRREREKRTVFKP